MPTAIAERRKLLGIASGQLMAGIREPARVATTGNITLSGLQTIDGVDLEPGFRVLVKNQSNASENGIYQAGYNSWVRAPDARNTRAINKGTLIVVQVGNVNAGLTFVFTTLDPDLGDDDIAIEAHPDIAGLLTDIASLTAALAAKLATAANLSDLASAATAFANIKQAATDTASGVVELATTTEAQAGADTSRAVTPAGLRSASRERLTSNRTYYVRTDGSNSNTGLVNNAGGAFLTGQKAWDTIYKTLDLNGLAARVEFAVGTYTTTINVAGMPPGQSYAHQITFVGQAGVILSVTGGHCFNVGEDNGGISHISIEDMELRTTTSGTCIRVLNSSYVLYNNVRFGPCAGFHKEAHHCATLKANGNFSVTGGAVAHDYIVSGSMDIMYTRTITYSNSPAFSYANFAATTQGQIFADNMTFTNGGTVTGSRYVAEGRGIIWTGQSSGTYIPGNASGTTATQGLIDSELGTFSQVIPADRGIRFNNQTSAAGASAGTMSNAPTAGNPAFWLKINIAGTNYAIPCWLG